MLQIGLTGGIACGKSTVAKFFSDCGTPTIDADIVAREVVAPGTKALSNIIDYFGPRLLTSAGQLDRKKMRQLIFSDSSAKRQLEHILHPEICQRMSQAVDQFKKLGATYCIKIIPLLFETNQHKTVGRILVVDCPEATQLQRIVARDSTTEVDAKKIIDSQILRQQRLKMADDIICNDSELEKIRDGVFRLHQFYLKQASGDQPTN